MTINGYDLASRVLAVSAFACDDLLKLAGNQETEWLEFKAVLYPPPNDESQPQSDRRTSSTRANDSDYFWHVAKAVIAMANSSGGVVLLGVSDDGTPVDLALSDPKGFLASSHDDFFRQTLDKAILPESRKWSTGTQGIWTIDRLPTQLVEAHAATLMSQPVIAILIRPLPPNTKQLFKCVEIVNGAAHRSIVLCRQSGQVGRVREIIDHDQIQEFLNTRQVESPIFEGLWTRFSDATPISNEQLHQTLANASELRKQLETELRRIKSYVKAVSTSSKNLGNGDSAQYSMPKLAIPALQEETEDEVVLDAGFVKSYKIFADTDALMHNMASSFFESSLAPLLRASNEQLLISERTVDFFLEATTKGSRHTAHKAQSGLGILQRLQQAGCATDCKDPYPIPGDRFATDILFKELFVKYQLDSSLCLVTQNPSLAADILTNSRSAAFQKAKPVRVIYLDHDGSPRNWSAKFQTREPGANHRKTRGRRIEEEVAESFRILADTSSLMLFHDETKSFAGKKFFIETLRPLLIRSKNTLLVPMQVTAEVQRHLKSSNTLLAQQAESAEYVLQEYLRVGLLDVGDEDHETKAGSTFADQAFVRIAIRFASTTNICFITQDRELARTLLVNAGSGGNALGYELKVAYISPHTGKLGDWTLRLARETNNTANGSEPKLSSAENRNNRREVFDVVDKPLRTVDSARKDSRGTKNAQEREQKVQPFAICEKPYAIDTTLLPCVRFPREGDEVLSTRHGRLKLVKEVAAGGEGTIYTTTDHQLVCKIYHRECLTQSRKAKLELMLSRRVRIHGVCWPVDLVETTSGEFVGYLMPMAKGKILKTTVFAKPLLNAHFPTWTRVNLTHLAITILRKIEQLHELNIFIGDINPQNILVVDDSHICIVDTDSFQVEGFPCPVGTDTFTPPSRQGQNFAEFLRSKDDELFAVTTLLFMVLFPGKAPYSAQGGGEAAENIRNRVFPYVAQENGGKNIKPVGAWQFIWSHLHPRMKDNFVAVFHRQERVKIGDLIRHLYASIKDIEAGNRSNELFPKQPRLIEGKTVTAICDICGKPDEISESFAKKLEEEGGKFRHSDCVTLKRLQRLESTREVRCAICGEIKVAAVEHLEKVNARGQNYRCQDCAQQRRKSRERTPRSSSNCFIATAVYGSHAPETNALREWRDRSLLPHYLGRVLVSIYYTMSPSLVPIVTRNKWIRNSVKSLLDRVVNAVS